MGLHKTYDNIISLKWAFVNALQEIHTKVLSKKIFGHTKQTNAKYGAALV